MIIFRYLAKEIYSALLASTAVLLLIFISNQFVRYLKYAAQGRFPAKAVLLVMSLKIPELLGVLLPLSLFLGILLGYGRLYADNEMTVLFASGTSRNKLIKVALSCGVAVALIVSILTLWAGPHLNKYAKKVMAGGSFSPIELIAPGHFQSVQGGKWVLYVPKVSNGHKILYDVFSAEQDNKSAGILTARSGYQQIDKKTGDIFLVFNEGNRYTGFAGQKDYRIVNFNKYGIRIDQGKADEDRRVDSMPTSALFSNTGMKGRDAELQWRFSMPIMALILALLAVPLSRVKTRQGRYAQLVPAVLLYIVYGNFMFLSKSWLYDSKISPYLGMWWLHAVMLIIAGSLLIRQRLKL